MRKELKLDDKLLDGLDLTAIKSDDIRKNKIYDRTHFTKTSEIKTALQGIYTNIDTSKDYSGKDIKDIIKKLYDKM